MNYIEQGSEEQSPYLVFFEKYLVGNPNDFIGKLRTAKHKIPQCLAGRPMNDGDILCAVDGSLPVGICPMMDKENLRFTVVELSFTESTMMDSERARIFEQIAVHKLPIMVFYAGQYKLHLHTYYQSAFSAKRAISSAKKFYEDYFGYGFGRDAGKHSAKIIPYRVDRINSGVVTGFYNVHYPTDWSIYPIKEDGSQLPIREALIQAEEVASRETFETFNRLKSYAAGESHFGKVIEYLFNPASVVLKWEVEVDGRMVELDSPSFYVHQPDLHCAILRQGVGCIHEMEPKLYKDVMHRLLAEKQTVEIGIDSYEFLHSIYGDIARTIRTYLIETKVGESESQFYLGSSFIERRGVICVSEYHLRNYIQRNCSVKRMSERVINSILWHLGLKYLEVELGRYGMCKCYAIAKDVYRNEYDSHGSADYKALANAEPISEEEDNEWESYGIEEENDGNRL